MFNCWRKKSRVVCLALVVLLVLSLLAGCGNKNASEGGSSQTAASEPAKEKKIVDDAGRTVTVPTKIDKVYFTSPMGQILVYTLAPEKMVGWTMQLSDNEKKYLLSDYWDLPYLGGQQMNSKLNTEEIIKVHPQVIINVSMGKADATTVSQSDQLQKQLNIPVVVVNGQLENAAKAYTFVGELLGVESRAKVLADYCNETLSSVTEAVKSVPEDKKVRVYYAEGPNGLATEPESSDHAALLGLVGAINVADVEAKGGGGMSNVSLEQVLKWNPDVILAWGSSRGGACDKIRSSQEWKNIKAVKEGKVYEVPNSPFNWFDRPPSVNRILGLKWLAGTLYPEYYKVDMVNEVKEFYKLFYHVDITDDDAKSLLKNSLH